MPKDERYTITVYVAAPGTPLYADAGEGTYAPTGKQSTTGHMFYSVSDGASEQSYGFAPIKEGSPWGPGEVKATDRHHYRDPIYSRTLEVSKEQYELARDFGDDAIRKTNSKFDLQYLDVRNNCVDFTWSALGHAGIHTPKMRDLMPERPGLLLEPDGARKGFQGDVRPLENIDEIKRIPEQIPGARRIEQQNPMPRRSPLQWLLSEEALRDPAHPLHQDFSSIQSGVAVMDAAANKPRDAKSANMEASLLGLAVRNGIRVDWTMLGIATEHVQAGKNVFVGEGEPTAQPRRWAHMDTQTAINTPAEESFRQVASLQAERAQLAQIAPMQVQDTALETHGRQRTV